MKRTLTILTSVALAFSFVLVVAYSYFIFKYSLDNARHYRYECICDDNVDNDLDGLWDCDDPDCLFQSVCKI